MDLRLTTGCVSEVVTVYTWHLLVLPVSISIGY